MKPIIMSTEDARGILGGRKTMARMPIRTPHGGALEVHADIAGVPRLCERCGDRCRGLTPPYEIGDVLWVRETWRVGAWDDAGSICVDYKADGFTRREWIIISDSDLYEELWQQSSDDARKANASIDDDGNYNWEPGKGPTRWRSPVTMPREAARLFLRVKDVRVERVQDITERDAKREGVITNDAVKVSSYVYWFKELWDARNAKRGYGWDSNPWVWILEFERTPSGAIGPEPFEAGKVLLKVTEEGVCSNSTEVSNEVKALLGIVSPSLRYLDTFGKKEQK